MKEKTVVTKLPAGEIIEIKNLADGTYEVTQKVMVEDKAEDIELVLIEAESLSLDDEFMKHKPCTESEVITKELIVEAIESGVKNYYRPVMDPSFTADGIAYVAGKKPAIGKAYNSWNKIAKEFNPSRNSRLGTRLEYGAFLAVLIKMLIAEGKSIKWAWNAVCNDSKELGHYCNSENAKRGYEPTGSRLICGFYDLVNTCKILSADRESDGFWLAGGSTWRYSHECPLASLRHYNVRLREPTSNVGWIVFPQVLASAA